MTINEHALSAAYAVYDSDPRVNGPDDADAFRAGIEAYLADAAAAPAVGVTVEQMEQLQQLGRPINTPIIVSVSLHDVMAVLSFLYDEHGLHLPLAVQNAHDRMMESAYAVARERAALLTAQPDSAPDDVDWKSWRKHIREYRMNQRVSMYDMAKLLGVTSAQYCSMELAELTPNVEQQSIIEQRLGIGDTMTAQPEPGEQP